jgi:serine/threonine protein phosphatase PrpC
MDISPILASALEDAVYTVEESVRHMFHTQDDTSGACAGIVAFRGGRLCACNMGDVQTWLFDEEGGVHSLCVVHRSSSEAEKERLALSGVPVKGGRVMGILEPSRAFGDFDIKSRSPLSVLCKPFVANVVLKKNKRWTLPHTEEVSFCATTHMTSFMLAGRTVPEP